jgi:hypothetical protein
VNNRTSDDCAHWENVVGPLANISRHVADCRIQYPSSRSKPRPIKMTMVQLAKAQAPIMRRRVESGRSLSDLRVIESDI